MSGMEAGLREWVGICVVREGRWRLSVSRLANVANADDSSPASNMPHSPPARPRSLSVSLLELDLEEPEKRRENNQ